ncbi:hypothetical protein JCM11251_006885 [Rhodosporidiobolus azoricus]
MAPRDWRKQPLANTPSWGASSRPVGAGSWDIEGSHTVPPVKGPVPRRPKVITNWRDVDGVYDKAERYIPRQDSRGLEPTKEYLRAVETRGTSSFISSGLPITVVLSPDHTLVACQELLKYTHRYPVVRPYLSTFLEYVCGQDDETGKPRFLPTVFSSARSSHALSTLAALNLIPIFKVPARHVWQEYAPTSGEGDVLKTVLYREQTERANEPVVDRDLSRLATAIELPGPPDTTSDARLAGRMVLLGLAEDASVSFALLPACPLLILTIYVLQTRQPHNSIAIPPFLLHAYDFPNRRDPVATEPAARELDADHPLAADHQLLIMIYILERLRQQTNVGLSIKAGFAQHIRQEITDGLEMDDAAADTLLAERGKSVCSQLGIEVRRRWDPEWREKMLEKEGRILNANIDARARDHVRQVRIEDERNARLAAQEKAKRAAAKANKPVAIRAESDVQRCRRLAREEGVLPAILLLMSSSP